MIKKLLIFLVLASVGAAAVAGCGGSGSDPLTKAQFMKQAEAICEKADTAQANELSVALKEDPKAPQTTKGKEELVLQVGLPPIQTEAEELGDLAPPSADEAEVEAIIEGFEEGVEKAEGDPLSVTKPAGNPFTEVEKLAAKYGFKNCAEPL